MVTAARALAHLRRATIAVALREPGPSTFAMFDDLLLVAGGRLLYAGPQAAAVPHFNALGFDFAGSGGPATFLHVRNPLSWPLSSCRRS